MTCYSQKTILIALIVALGIQASTSRRGRWRRSEEFDDTQQYIRSLCSETQRQEACWNIIKPYLGRFRDPDDTDIATAVIRLAIEKSETIETQLSRWYRDSNDDALRRKYGSCSKSYSEANRNLEQAQRSLDSDDYRRISDQIDDASQRLEECRREFGSGSFDPGHVGERNNEFGLYLDFARAATSPFDELI